MNVRIIGSIASISNTETFQYNGTTYNFKEIVINTPAYQNKTEPVVVKVNADKYNLDNFKVGDCVDIDANIKSKSNTSKTGKTFWNTTLTLWKIQLHQQQQQQPVQQQQQTVYQQPVQQQNPNPMQGVPQLNQDGSVKDDDLPF